MSSDSSKKSEESSKSSGGESKLAPQTNRMKLGPQKGSTRGAVAKLAPQSSASTSGSGSSSGGSTTTTSATPPPSSTPPPTTASTSSSNSSSSTPAPSASTSSSASTTASSSASTSSSSAPTESKQKSADADNDSGNDDGGDGGGSGGGGGDKHPLQHKWAMSYLVPNPPEWEVKPIMDVDSVEDFWSMYNNLQKPSALPLNSNYHLFKHGVKPVWEDKNNENGGQWIAETRDPKELDEMWLYLLLALIGEQFDHPNEILGAVVSLRKYGHRVALWTRTADEREIQMSIGKDYSKVIELKPGQKLQFKAHESELRKAMVKRRGKGASEVLYEINA